ncbi:MAG: hypothetical protein GY861_15770 [bacterium]|nr:hypothetical protein [bacterium]
MALEDLRLPYWEERSRANHRGSTVLQNMKGNLLEEIVNDSAGCVRNKTLTTLLTLFTVAAIAAGSVIAYKSCESNNDSTPPPITPIVTVEPTYPPTPTVTPDPTVMPTPETPTSTETPTPLPDVPEDVSHNLDVLSDYNPKLVDFLREQPWYLDGINEEESIFILDGLGRKPSAQGVGPSDSRNDVLMKIVENEQYKIEKVQLNGGEKNVLVMYEEDHMLDPVMNLALAAAPRVEDYLGMEFPRDTLTVYVRSEGGDFGVNATAIVVKPDADFFPERAVVREIKHAMWHTDSEGRMGRTEDMEQSEGDAELCAYVVLEELSKTNPDLLSKEYTVEERFTYAVNKLNGLGLLSEPATSPRFDNQRLGTHYLKWFMVLNDVRNAMGAEAYSAARGEMYEYKDNYDGPLLQGPVIKEKELQEFMMKHAPNPLAVETIFTMSVFGE